MEDVRRKHTYHILSRYKLIMFEFEFSILQAHQVLHLLLLALTTRPAPPIQLNALPWFPIIITGLHKLLIYLSKVPSFFKKIHFSA